MRTRRRPASRPAPTRGTAGRVALVTGAASGLGRATAGALAEAGLGVVVADIDLAAAESAAAAIMRDGGQALAVEMDVTDRDSVAAAVGRVVSDHGRLDVLVNNAGVDVTAPFEDIPAGDWDHVLDVDLVGPANAVRGALPYLVAHRGDIINITSTAARRAWPNASAYHAAKWGLLGLSHALHAELRSRGVRVTAVICGGMRTPFLLRRFPELDPGRLMDPARVAGAIRWVIEQPRDVVVAELLIAPLTEESWP